MKKMLVLAALLMLPGNVLASAPPPQTTGSLDWSVATSWNLSAKPLDFVQSLDNKMVFILGDDSKVHIYSVNGSILGEIPVDKETVAIDISPRGEMLYLLDSNKKYSAISISFTQNIDISTAPILGKKDAPVTMVVFSDFQ